MKIFRRVSSAFLALVVSVMTFAGISAFAFTYDFNPSSTVYNTTTSTVYSDAVNYGQKSQDCTGKFWFSVNVPPNSGNFTITMTGTLQVQTTTGWVTVRKLTASVTVKNSTASAYQYVRGSDSKDDIGMINGNTYRVAYKVTSNGTSKKFSLNPCYSLDIDID
ncbi:MAG: hypothetical protein QM689_07225 [Oscillospiraceae bacterium]